MATSSGKIWAKLTTFLASIFFGSVAPWDERCIYLHLVDLYGKYNSPMDFMGQIIMTTKIPQL